jgi:integrase
MPAVMAKLAESTGTGAACLRFCILTATRSGEARGARWTEIDMAGKSWTIPAARMKAKAEHRIPLTDAALAILRAAWPPEATEKPASGLVFPGGTKSAPLSDVAVSKALRAAAEGVTVHGCRSSFRDWAGDASGFAREVAEAALAHTMKDKTEAAYARTDHFERRRRLMDAWAAHCTGTESEPAENVTPLHVAGKK